ncbi:unnamed protein product, partial [Closterium sp. NIES-65]
NDDILWLDFFRPQTHQQPSHIVARTFVRCDAARQGSSRRQSQQSVSAGATARAKGARSPAGAATAERLRVRKEGSAPRKAEVPAPGAGRARGELDAFETWLCGREAHRESAKGEKDGSGRGAGRQRGGPAQPSSAPTPTAPQRAAQPRQQKARRVRNSYASLADVAMAGMTWIAGPEGVKIEGSVQRWREDEGRERRVLVERAVVSLQLFLPLSLVDLSLRAMWQGIINRWPGLCASWVGAAVQAASGIVVQAQDNGWMDETAVQTWLSKEVLPHLNPQRGQNARRAMLVLDSYRGHITQTMLQSYRTHSITPAVIPAGCTSQIQPLDVSINRCFKAAVRARYARWFMREGIHLKTKKGNLRRPPHPVVLQWIAEAWDQVPKQIIIDAFRHCGISSKLDGTENHLVMSHLRARSTTDVSADMSLGGTTGDNTRLLGRAPEEEEEAMQAEGVREVAVATGLEVLYQEIPNYRGAAAEADRMIEPRETARHAWRVPDLGIEPDVSAGEEAVTEGG